MTAPRPCGKGVDLRRVRHRPGRKIRMDSAPRPLGTMVAYGFERGSVAVDLDVAALLGATCLEILPDWSRLPDPLVMRDLAADRGLSIHSAHGCWGGRSIRAPRVDLGSTDPSTWQASLDDLRACLDWLRSAGGSCLIVHPGGYSDPAERDARADALSRSLLALAEHAGPSGPVLCVENMPPGVHPGSRMADLTRIVSGLNLPGVGLAIDTGHALLVASPADETRAAGDWLRTTHVHDNDGRKDSHLPPGAGAVDWDAWAASLDEIRYCGPIMLECIRLLRQDPAIIDERFLARLSTLTGGPRDRR